MILRPSNRNQTFIGRAGFTMIEIMIAITLFMMIIAAIYSAWSSIVRGTEIAMRAADNVQRTRVAIRALEESLGSIVNFQSGRTNYYAFVADFESNPPILSFVARLPESFIGSGRYVNAPMRRVTFSLEPGQNGAQLVMTQRPVLEATELVDQPYKIVLAPNISMFQMEFFDRRMGEWIPEWLDTNNIPPVVRVAVGFGSRGHGFNAQPELVTTRVITMAASPVRRAAGPPQATGVQQPPRGVPPPGVPAPGAPAPGSGTGTFSSGGR